MNLRSRLKKLAELTDLSEWEDVRPRDTDPATWEAIGRKLVELPPFVLYPFDSILDVVGWLASVRPERLLGCPGAILQAATAAAAELAGEEFQAIDFASLTDEELDEIVSKS